MIKKLAKSVREFRTPAMLTPVFVVGEVLMQASTVPEQAPALQGI